MKVHKRLAAAVLFGAIGFGMGLLAALRGADAAEIPTWIPALTLGGFAGGTGGGIGRGGRLPFVLGIAGALAGAGIGWLLDLSAAGWPGALVSALALNLALASVPARPAHTRRTRSSPNH